jgi:Transposase DDE domain
LEPQIVVGLLTDPSGFPLLVNAFEGNTAETKTMLPVIEAFLVTHQVREVTIVADAGMISEGNRKAIEDAGLSFILGMKIPDVPYVVKKWREDHVDTETGEIPDLPDGHIFTQPWPAGPKDKRRDQMIYYQYKADRARRTLRGIEQQVAKAERAVAGEISVKRNRFVKLSGGTKTINQDLVSKTRALAGIKGYWTDLDRNTAGAQFVIGAYHRLFLIEKSFRMSKHDLQARPIYHRKTESIDAHLTIVFAALAVGHWVETRTGWSIKKFVRTARRYRTVNIRAGDQIITAADPLPDDLHDALTKIHQKGAH